MKNRKKAILLIVAVILLVPLLYSYYAYSAVKVTNRYTDGFSESLLAAVQRNETFDMADITAFDWDTMMVFYPYTSREEMEKRVGREWTTYAYLGYYLIQKTFLGDYPLDDDSFNKIIFLKEDKIVLDATFNRRKVDFTQIDQVIERAEARFDVQEKSLKQNMQVDLTSWDEDGVYRFLHEVQRGIGQLPAQTNAKAQIIEQYERYFSPELSKEIVDSLYVPIEGGWKIPDGDAGYIFFVPGGGAEESEVTIAYHKDYISVSETYAFGMFKEVEYTIRHVENKPKITEWKRVFD